MTDPFHPSVLAANAWKVTSQNGEDGVIAHILRHVPHNRTCFEIGGGLVNGTPESNTYNLLVNGWQGVIVDEKEIVHPWFQQERVTVGTVNALPLNFRDRRLGVLSIDVDGIDYWLWKAIDIVQPTVVVIEYNASRPRDSRQVVPYDPAFSWDGSDYFGASAGAMIELGKSKGYTLVAAVACLNLFFVRTELLNGHTIYPPDQLPLGPCHRHPTDRSGRKYLEV